MTQLQCKTNWTICFYFRCDLTQILFRTCWPWCWRGLKCIHLHMIRYKYRLLWGWDFLWGCIEWYLGESSQTWSRQSPALDWLLPVQHRSEQKCGSSHDCDDCPVLTSSIKLIIWSMVLSLVSQVSMSVTTFWQRSQRKVRCVSWGLAVVTINSRVTVSLNMIRQWLTMMCGKSEKMEDVFLSCSNCTF